MPKDPKFLNQLDLSKMLFDRIPMGIAILDREYNIVRYNPTWKEFAELYAPPTGIALSPGVNYFDLLPGSESIAIPLFERVLRGETIQQDATEFITGGITSYWNLILAPLVENGEIVGILNATNDVTDYFYLQQNLEKRVDERTHELQTLLQISRDINSNLDLDILLETLLDQLKNVVDYTGASIFTLNGNNLNNRVNRGSVPRYTTEQVGFLIEEIFTEHDRSSKNTPWIIPDLYENSSKGNIFEKIAGDQIQSIFGDIHSWMGVPLVAKEKTLGLLILYHVEVDHFSKQNADLVLTIANHAAVAIENAQLYEDTEDRIEESETLFSVQQAITSKLELDEVLQMIADEARRLTSTDISGVYLLKGDKLEISYVSGDVPKTILGYRLSLDSSIAGRVIKEQKAILINDTWNDPKVDRSASDHVRARSLLIVPLISGDEPVGTITVAKFEPGTFKPGVEELLTKLAANVVICLENAQLYESEQDRRQVAEGLRETLAVLNSKQPLDEILDHIAKQAVRLMGACSAIIYHITPESHELSIQAGSQIPEAIQRIESIPVYEGGAVASMFNSEPYIINDIQAHLGNIDIDVHKNKNKLSQWLGAIKENFGSYLGVPLIIDDLVYGSLGLYYQEANEFSDEQIELGVALANQAVLAIENARLLEQSEDAAVTAERNRLARDLHDAVTQTLFSASMIADVLPKIWEKDQDAGRFRLEELRQLTRGALSEMRTLLVELRPAALVDTDLGDLIGHQVNAFIARTRIPVKYDKQCSQNPPAEIKEMFYRVVQEAFNNIVKHANATTINVELTSDMVNTSLLIEDDGIGFDLNTGKSKGLGLGIMTERAQNMNAKLEIKSKVGNGTRIQITWQNQELKEKDHE